MTWIEKVASRMHGRLATAAAIVAPLVMYSACQQVVSVDLNNASPQTVIQGAVTDRHGPYTIQISRTGSYFTPTFDFPAVSNATVVISDNEGNTDTLHESTPGNYISSHLFGTPGRTYLLSVDADGRRYSAVSQMPTAVRIDSLYATPMREYDGDKGYNIYIQFHDPPEPGNCYRIDYHGKAQLLQDSVGFRRYRLMNDRLINGSEASYRIRIGRNISPGDTISIDLLTIDKSAYDYFSTLNDVLTSDRSPTSLSPANPNTNLSNGSLGYFAAYTIDTRRLVLP